MSDYAVHIESGETERICFDCLTMVGYVKQFGSDVITFSVSESCEFVFASRESEFLRQQIERNKLYQLRLSRQGIELTSFASF